MVTKRIIDIACSILALLILFFPILILCLFVWLKIGKPVFFKQTRAGINGAPFQMIKFRTMTNECDLSGNLLPDEKRFTKLGKFLRTTSLDEIPEFWNVLKGDMSLVGPRPLLMQYLGRYNPVQARRHDVRPGLTGWAQINGRNALSWNERFKYDVWYVDNRTFLLDVKILFLTVVKVFKRDNVNTDTGLTMSEFFNEDGEVL